MAQGRPGRTAASRQAQDAMEKMTDDDGGFHGSMRGSGWMRRHSVREMEHRKIAEKRRSLKNAKRGHARSG